MKYSINKTEHPVYLQLYRLLRDDIVRENYKTGDRLPSKRLLAEETQTSTITVEHAYGLLCDEGYAEARQRSGFFVVFRPGDGFASSEKSVVQSPSPKKEVSEKPSFPVSLLCKTMRRVLSDYNDRILEKSPNTGLVELRRALRLFLARNKGIEVEESRIVVGSGAEYLYALLVDMLGRDKVYAFEDPSYEKIGKIYHATGVKYEKLPLSEDGIDSSALAASKADVLHTTPCRSFPSGVSASASKRYEYIRWADRADRFIIESDYDSEFAVAAKPADTIFALADRDNVIYLNTFSKTISPSMRVGYMVLPEKLVKPFEEKVGFYSCTVPTYEQFVLTELLNSGDFERHINRVRRAKRKELQNG